MLDVDGVRGHPFPRPPSPRLAEDAKRTLRERARSERKLEFPLRSAECNGDCALCRCGVNGADVECCSGVSSGVAMDLDSSMGGVVAARSPSDMFCASTALIRSACGANVRLPLLLAESTLNPWTLMIAVNCGAAPSSSSSSVSFLGLRCRSPSPRRADGVR